ncbi:MAG: glutamate formiminotransferase [Thermoleophilaceae bacterium]|nr:glutamate formiminotransferase [Thermoleophilaceae bacterium]
MAGSPLLLAVPNVSEGRDADVIEAIGQGFAPARLLDLHGDTDHHRSVFTLAASPAELPEALLGGAREAVARIDLRDHHGLHPRVGALDVMPVVYLDDGQRGAACAAVLTAAGLIGEELGVPVVLYGELATRPEHLRRSDLRAGGREGIAARLEAGEIVPDYGPPRAHPMAGAVLAAARPPLVAFNVDLDSDDLELAQRIAVGLRESGGGLPGVRALGLYLPERGRAQVSTNVEDHRLTPLREVVEAVRSQAPVAEAELVGLAPKAAFARFPEDVPLRGFSPERHLIEYVLRGLT